MEISVSLWWPIVLCFMTSWNIQTINVSFQNSFYSMQNSKKVPQSNFLSTVIFNFDYVFFFGIYCHFIDIGLSHWVSATKEIFSWSQTRSKTPFLWPTNDSFVALTHCDELVLRKWQKMPEKETWSKLKTIVLRKLDWGTFKGNVELLLIV